MINKFRNNEQPKFESKNWRKQKYSTLNKQSTVCQHRASFESER